MENNEYPIPPMSGSDEATLEELSEHILYVEDVAAIAANRAKALEFVIGNLLAELARKGMLDSGGFLDKLDRNLGQIESLADRSAAEGLISVLRSFLPGSPPVPPKPPGSSATH